MSGPSRGWISQASARLTGFLVLACSLALGACTSLPRTPYTSAEASTSRVLDIDGLRRYADEPVTKFSFDKDTSTATKSYLALSGGGADGAYGVGVLSGWTAARTRPTFSVVSGVSTGGLIAPFAFLGSQYDDTLREVYTSGIAESLLNDPSIMRVLFGSGLFGNTRLRELVARYVGPEIMAQVARENARGRKLLVVTTDLDTQRTAIWDMGKIAAVGTPEALKLFRDVMAASASIPSLSSITQSQTRSIIFSTYDFAKRNNLGFHLSYIARDYPAPPSEGFDTAYMRALYQYGYEKAASGQAWTSKLP